MCQAMAWRVKYRTQPNGHKIKLHISGLGAHPKNRCGVYPAGVRCKGLAKESIDVGYQKEEINTNVCAVEEVPVAHVRSRGNDYVCGST